MKRVTAISLILVSLIVANASASEKALKREVKKCNNQMRAEIELRDDVLRELFTVKDKQEEMRLKMRECSISAARRNFTCNCFDIEQVREEADECMDEWLRQMYRDMDSYHRTP